MLDIGTVAFLGCLCSLIAAIVQFLAARKYPDYVGLSMRRWGVGLALAGIGHIPLALRHIVPGDVSQLLANGLISLSVVEYNRAVRALKQEKPLTAYYATAAGLGFLLFTWFLMMHADVAARVMVVNVAIIALLLPLCYDLFKNVSPDKRATYWSTGVLFGWVLVVLLARTVATWNGYYSPRTNLYGGSAMQSVLFGSTFIVSVVAGFLFLLMASDEFAAQITRLATFDALTDILNRRTFEDLAGRALLVNHQRGDASTLLMLDVDHFKTVNDRYGHPVGDAVLRAVAQAITAQLRAGDIFGRYGGEEFCVLLPDTGGRAAVAIAERLRRTIEEQPIGAGENALHLTVSIGIATTTGQHQDINVLFAESDRALYRAKESGRNRVALA